MYSHVGLLLLTLVQGPSPGPVPLYKDLGQHHHAISSKVPQAQEYFDQGLRLVFGFNHGEAIRAFNEAARLDPNCAICYWGTALAYGPHVHAPMDSAGGYVMAVSIDGDSASEIPVQVRTSTNTTTRAAMLSCKPPLAALDPPSRPARFSPPPSCSKH